MKDGMIYNFNRLGLLLSEVDRNGNKTVYCYYPNSSRLKCIKDPNGMEYTFAQLPGQHHRPTRKMEEDIKIEASSKTLDKAYRACLCS